MSHLLPIIEISNQQFEAQILLQGAQLMHFVPREKKPWIFANANTPFTPGKEIYGGVPLVFPWFSRLKEHPDAPNHGFARSASWTLEAQDEGLVSLSLSSANVRDQGLQSPFWSGEFFARMVFSLGESLGMRFEVMNRGEQTMRFECALHTYFAVSDVRQTRVEGLEGGVTVGGDDEPPVEDEVLKFPPFGSRVFAASGGPVRIQTPERTFRLDNREGWRSTIVWNPGQAMEDVKGDDWTRFVCVEAGAIRGNAVEPGSGESYALDVSVTLD